MELDPGKRTSKTGPGIPITPPISQVITVKPAGHDRLTIDPDQALINLKGWVQWDISQLQIPTGGGVLIEFTDDPSGKKGPFPHDGSDNHNIARGKYQCKKNHPGEHAIKTAREDVGKSKPVKYWKYEVSVFDSAGKKVRFADPGVGISDGGTMGDGH